jgi:hypothetical protein
MVHGVFAVCEHLLAYLKTFDKQRDDRKTDFNKFMSGCVERRGYINPFSDSVLLPSSSYSESSVSPKLRGMVGMAVWALGVVQNS